MIRIAPFYGEIPRLTPRLLPAGFAQVASDVKLENGALVPINGSRLAETLAGTRASFVKHKSEWIGLTYAANFAQGPIASDRLYIMGQGAARPLMYVDGPGGTFLPLRIKRPDTRLEAKVITGDKSKKPEKDRVIELVTQGDRDNIVTEGGDNIVVSTTKLIEDNTDIDPDTQVSIIYTYTYVSEYGEESEPAKASKPVVWSTDHIVRLKNFDRRENDERVAKIRVYRSQTSASGQTDFFFVKEISPDTKSWDDNPSKFEIAEAIASTDYNEPPDNLEGLIALPNGMMAAFVGKQLYFCEPYLPHAWPQKYILTTDVNIVALAAIGSSVIVLTQGTSYIATGSSPETMVMDKIEDSFPCAAALGVVDLGTGIVFPSADGLVLLTSAGSQLISRKLMTQDQWQALNPSTFIAGHFNGRYLASYEVDSVRKTIIFDLTGEQPFISRTSDAIEATFHEKPTGRLFILLDGNKVYEFDDPQEDPRDMNWWSKRHVLSGYANYGCILIEGDDYGTSAATSGALTGPTVKVYADGTLVHTETTMNVPMRLPGGFLASAWEVRVQGDKAVAAITLAGSPSEIGAAAPP